MPRPPRDRNNRESTMSRKRKATEKNEWDGKSAWEQIHLAYRGTTKVESELPSFVIRLDYITAREKNGQVIGDEKTAWAFYKWEFGKKLMDLWWNAKNSKRGEAFRQLAWIAEQKPAVHPDYQCVAWLKLQHEQGKLPALPVTAIVKIYNEHRRQTSITGLVKTNYRQIDRICKKLRQAILPRPPALPR